jgi:poly(3-hydroxybutyrate) depolymerase
VHVLAVCQPTVPVFAAVSLMESRGERSVPRSMTLMAGPIDTRQSPTEVNRFAERHTINWFERHAITQVPWPYPGMMRNVYPGFLQLSGFMGMNLDRHLTAHRDLFHNLIRGDGDSADKHREFYDEFLAVMDLTEEYYLQTIETVFLEHALPKGEMRHRGEPVDPSAIRRVALMTVEGEKDDISGLGQTEAAHTLSPNLADSMRARYVQEGVGHYGVFNGRRFRSEIVPRLRQFIGAHDGRFNLLARARNLLS